MVLFRIQKDIVPTSVEYNYTKDTTFSGVVTVSIGARQYQYSMSNVRATVLDRSDVYARVQIEGVFIVPQPFVLQAISMGGTLTKVTLGDMSISLPLGGYYVRVVVTVQSPNTFDLFVA